MPPVYITAYVVRDDSSDKAQEENKSSDQSTTTPPSTGSNAGLIAGAITSVAVVLFLLVVVVVAFIKKRRQQKEADKTISGPTRTMGPNGLLGGDLSYNRAHKRLSLVDKLSVTSSRQSGEQMRENRISVLSAMVPRSGRNPSNPFNSPMRQSFQYKREGSPIPPPLQPVPENVDVNERTSVYYDEKDVAAKSASPLSAYIQHHLQTYSANGIQSNFPVSAPVYQASFNAPQARHRRQSDFSDNSNSPESPYTPSVYASSEASEYDDHHMPLPSAPPGLSYSQQAAQDRARGRTLTPSGAGVADLLRRRSSQYEASKAASSDKATKASSDKKRPPPLPLSPDEPEFTIKINPAVDDRDDRDECLTAAQMPLPLSAAPLSAAPASAIPPRSPVRGGISAKLSAKLTASRVPIPVTPNEHVVISPAAMTGAGRTPSFSDIPYPRSR